LVAELRAQNAELRAQNAELQAQIGALTQRVAALEEIVRANSTNSSKPPSSDGPAVQKPKKEPSGRQRGAQPGHEGKAREMVPPERVDRVMEVRPERCEHCQAPLAQAPESYRPHQVIELPKVRAEVTEWRLGIVRCWNCLHKTEAALPAGVPRGSFGPRMQATLSWASAELRLSKRKSAQAVEDLFDVPVSVGSVVGLQQSTSEAVREAVQEAQRYVQQQPGAKHLDETSWKQGQSRAWLWVAISGLVAVFAVRLSRGSKVARELLGRWVRGTVVSDRFSAYNWIGLWARQLCWAHLLRDFKAAAQRDGPGKAIAEALVKATRAMLRQWKRVREGQITRGTFQTYYAVRARATIHELLVQGRICPDKKLAALCRWLLKREQAMWTFARLDGVEPTNNAAERALRHAVLWRRSSHGTQSPQGSQFVERMLTVVTTLRLQKRNVLDYLTAACHAALLGLPAPSLLPTSQNQIAVPQLAATA
jgi:transposase